MIKWEYKKIEHEIWVFKENDDVDFFWHTYDIKKSIHRRMDIMFKLKNENEYRKVNSIIKETILKKTEAL